MVSEDGVFMRRSRVRMMKVEDFILHGHMTVPEKAIWENGIGAGRFAFRTR